jgi:hypothetical protein
MSEGSWSLACPFTAGALDGHEPNKFAFNLDLEKVACA